MSEENGNILDLGSIDFTPDWAKKDAGVNLGKIRPERDGDRKGMMDEGRGMRKSLGDRKPFGEKKPFSKKPFTGARRPRPVGFCQVIGVGQAVGAEGPMVRRV